MADSSPQISVELPQGLVRSFAAEEDLELGPAVLGRRFHLSSLCLPYEKLALEVALEVAL